MPPPYQVVSGTTTRWFVAINNATAGYDATADAHQLMGTAAGASRDRPAPPLPLA